MVTDSLTQPAAPAEAASRQQRVNQPVEDVRAEASAAGLVRSTRQASPAPREGLPLGHGHRVLLVVDGHQIRVGIPVEIGDRQGIDPVSGLDPDLHLVEEAVRKAAPGKE